MLAARSAAMIQAAANCKFSRKDPESVTDSFAKRYGRGVIILEGRIDVVLEVRNHCPHFGWGDGAQESVERSTVEPVIDACQVLGVPSWSDEHVVHGLRGPRVVLRVNMDWRICDRSNSKHANAHKISITEVYRPHTKGFEQSAYQAQDLVEGPAAHIPLDFTAVVHYLRNEEDCSGPNEFRRMGAHAEVVDLAPVELTDR